MTRLSKMAAVAALSTLALAACSSTTTATTGSSAATSAGSSAAAALACPAGQITGEGSSAQSNAIQEAIAGYNEACKNKAKIEYSATGSGAGIKNFNAGLVDFGGSDSILKTAEAEAAMKRCNGNPAWNLPMVVGPVAFSYNIAGVNKLVLNADLMAKIFMGQITTWNDPAIAALNAGVTLPSAKINVFYRSDESGTTENASKYLKAAAPTVWTPDASKTWKGKAGEGKPQNAGVAEAMKASANSFGYLEWSFAKDNKLGIAQIDNGSGAVELSSASVGKNLETAKITGTGNDLALQIDYATKVAGAYPAILVAYEIVCSSGLDSAKTAVLKDFLGYFASEAGQKGLEEIGYAPLPTSLRTKVATAVQAIK